jgi:hypothetical protein
MVQGTKEWFTGLPQRAQKSVEHMDSDAKVKHFCQLAGTEKMCSPAHSVFWLKSDGFVSSVVTFSFF